jgi:hypothetical protein
MRVAGTMIIFGWYLHCASSPRGVVVMITTAVADSERTDGASIIVYGGWLHIALVASS